MIRLMIKSQDEETNEQHHFQTSFGTESKNQHDVHGPEVEKMRRT